MDYYLIDQRFLTIAIMIKFILFYNRISQIQQQRGKCKFYTNIMMFTKICDASPQFNQYNRFQFLKSFSFDCLDKIKSIEMKFNQIQQDLERTSFQVIANKVKTMLDSYQVITHQIYDSCQSADVESLGHSIVKIFLQISSAIKWIIQSFSISYRKNVQKVEPIKQQTHRESQSQKFRKREISRFILKGVKQKLDSQANQLNQVWQDEVNEMLGAEAKSYYQSKNKILSINSSNLPLILEDTVDYFTKKGEYIDKFIALRQNYEGGSRLQQLQTGQSIYESELASRNFNATNKFRQMLNKYLQKMAVKPVPKNDFGVQVAPVVLTCDKFKKVAQKNKIKMLSDEIQKQKTVSRALKIQLQVYQKKLGHYLQTSQQYEIVKKSAKIAVSQFYNKKMVSNKKDQTLQSQSEVEQSINVKQERQIQLRQEKVTNKYKRNSHMLKSKSIEPIRKSNSAQQILADEQQQKIVEKYKKQNNFCQIFSIQIDLKAQNKAVAINKKFQNIQLKLYSKVIDLQLKNYFISHFRVSSKQHKAHQLGQSERKFISAKITMPSSEYATNFVNSPASVLDDNRLSIQNKSLFNKQANNAVSMNLKSTNNKLTKIKEDKIQTNHILRNTKAKTNVKLASQNFSIDNILLKNKSVFFYPENSNKQNINFKSHFQKIFSVGQIVPVSLNYLTLCSFFIQQNNARNYEILNLAEQCSSFKKTPLRRVKAATSSNITTLIHKQKSLHLLTQFQNAAHNVIFCKIYNQLLKLRQTDKSLSLKLILFIRFPYSLVHKPSQLYSKLLQCEQNTMQLSEVIAHFKRIWVLHNRCQSESCQIQMSDIKLGIPWCVHKQQILSYFGIKRQSIKYKQQYQEVEFNQFTSNQ